MKVTSLNRIAEQAVSHNANIKKQAMIQPGDIPHITNFSRAVFPVGERVQPHRHEDMTEVFFVESGEGLITIDGTTYPLLPGGCITVEPKEEHSLSNTGTQPLALIYFGIVPSPT